MAPQKSGAKGYELEEALKSYFWQAGYFVARGLPFKLSDEDVTDVDIWLYERPVASTRRRLIVDAKNKRSPKATERVIWASGLRHALRVDGAIVATTDRRDATKKLARMMDVIVLDGDAVGKLVNSQQLKRPDLLRSEEFDQAVKGVDEVRRSSRWREILSDARGSLLTSFGVHSANSNLAALRFFCSEFSDAQPGSNAASVALRLIYLASSYAVVSLDFLLAEYVFATADERRRAVIRALRYGESSESDTLEQFRMSVALARAYADNGNAVARQIERRFHQDADEVPADIIADYVARAVSSDSLFAAAREMERASALRSIPSFDVLSRDAKAMMGVLLDFCGLPRQRFAEAAGVKPDLVQYGAKSQDRGVAAPKTLFEGAGEQGPAKAFASNQGLIFNASTAAASSRDVASEPEPVGATSGDTDADSD